ncbi:MAG: GerMN domain-containing protein [Thermoleophilia bacterium]|nr:GerMN domain-containing protein [Thermoleophilia bacterium]
MTRFPCSPRLVALALTALALAAAACGGEEVAGDTAPATTAETTGTTEAPPPTETGPVETGTSEPEPPVEAMTVAIYLLRGEHVGVAHRTVEQQETVGTAALEELLRGPTTEEAAAGLGTSIPAGTALNGLTIEGGVATVDLSGGFDDGGGSLSMFTRLAQIVHTLTQFPTVDGVLFELDGVPVETFSSEGIVLDGPQTREEYEDQAPATLVETPAVGDTVTSPLRLSGTSNVFEATSNYELLDAAGNVLAEGFVTASCGTGCRGTFDVEVPFADTGEANGTLLVFELSAEDGSRVNVVEIPLAFAPTPCC